MKGNIFPQRVYLSYVRRTPRFKHMIPLFQGRTGLLWTNNEDEVIDICKWVATLFVFLNPPTNPATQCTPRVLKAKG